MNKKLLLLVPLIVFMFLGLTGCTDNSTLSRGPDMEDATSGDNEMAIAPAPASAPSNGIKSYSSISEGSRIQIRGTISLEVHNISDAVEDIRTLVNQHNARVASSEYGDSYRKYANISILVPKESFHELSEAIKNVGTKVTTENISSIDVTEEFVDIEARLNVMKQTENRFITLLSETATVNEIMSVERELMRLRGEIDSLEGRMKYLSKTTDNSVLNVHITEEVSITGSDWTFFDSLNNSVRSFVSFSKHIANFLISLIVFSPIIIGVGLLFFFGYKFGKRYIHRK
jgi:hypothetical protein